MPAEIGDRFPADTLAATGGETIDLTGLGGPAVIYFYPQDGTPACAREQMEFNRAAADYEGAGVRLVGVSVDSEESHRCVADEQGLRFPLVSDEDRSLSSRLGIVKDYGEHGLLAARTTLLLDRDATIRGVWHIGDADIDGHAQLVLEAARSLAEAPA